MRLPWRANGGSVAVTITAATFFEVVPFSVGLTPSRFSIDCRLCLVKPPSFSLSPVPLRPTTRP